MDAVCLNAKAEAYLEEEPPALRPAHVPEGADQGAHVACVCFRGCGMVST